jgi:hypothetical protein
MFNDLNRALERPQRAGLRLAEIVKRVFVKR